MTDWEMRGKPALIIIHMQHGIVGSSGNIPGLYEHVQKSGIITRQQAMLKAFRDKKLPVVYVSARHVASYLNPACKMPAYGNLFKLIEAGKSNADNLNVIPELTPQPGEPLLVNWLIGIFNNSGLDQVLKAAGVETVVLAGCATHIAVYTAALQAVDLWYSVVIPADASCANEEFAEAERVVLEMMAPNVAMVTTTDDVIAHLR